MQLTDDSALLREFVENNSEDAFASLVTKHVNLVYSVAMRCVSNPSAAEEITQAVFIILARKAGQLRNDKAISSWLFQTTRLTANNFLRTEMRRQRREQEAHDMQTSLNEPEPELWPRIAPLLDTAVANLKEKDRRAILLRFYEGKNLREIGTVLGASEAATEKRVSRAIEKLQNFFLERGITSTAETITGAISANSIQAAPALLAKTTTAVALAKGATASLSTSTLIKGALKLMAWTKAKIAVAAIAGVILATSVSVVVVEKAILIDGKTESQWIKSIVYNGDDNQTKRWLALGSRGMRMLLRALKNPAYDHSTRMCAADLLNRLGDRQSKEATRAIPNIINQIKIEKDDGVLQIELGYFEGLLQFASDKDKATLLPELLRAMQSNNGGVRNNALVALKFYAKQSDTAMQVIINSLQDSDAYVRLNAARELNEVNPQAAAKADVVRVLTDCATNLETDNEATVALGDLHLEPDVAVPALIQCLQSSKSYVRENAAVALGRFGGHAKSAVPALADALNDSDAGVKRLAALALKRINSNAVPK